PSRALAVEDGGGTIKHQFDVVSLRHLRRPLFLLSEVGNRALNVLIESAHTFADQLMPGRQRHRHSWKCKASLIEVFTTFSATSSNGDNILPSAYILLLPKLVYLLSLMPILLMSGKRLVAVFSSSWQA